MTSTASKQKFFHFGDDDTKIFGTKTLMNTAQNVFRKSEGWDENLA